MPVTKRKAPAKKSLGVRLQKFAKALLPTGVALLLTVDWMDTVLLNVPVLKPVFTILFLLTVPGFFLYRIIAGRTRRSFMRTLVNSVALSLLTIMLSTLALNQAGLAFGNRQPLVTPDVTITLGIVTAALIILAQLRTPLKFKKIIPRRLFSVKKVVAAVTLALPPVLAVGGATTLNNGGGNWLALTALGLAASLMLVAVWSRRRFNRYLPYVLYSVALTILLGTSMRGWNITGHDVMQEFQVYQLTLQHHLWNMSFYQDAYNACLSITILPTVLQLLTGLADQYIYKLVFPLFIALIVPALYLTMRPYFTRKTAFLAAGIFMSFSPFVMDFTMLNRQTTAFLFFVLALMTGLDKKLSRTSRTLLTFTFLTGMILSHYSSSYVGLTMLLMTIGLGVVVVLFRRIFMHRKTTGAFTIFNPAVVVAALMVLLLWNTFATQTSNNIKQTLQGIVSSVPSLLSGKGIGGSPNRVGATQSGVLAPYIDSLESNETLPSSEYYATIPASQDVSETTATDQAVNPVLAHIGVAEAGLGKFYSLAKSGYTVLLLGLAFAGTFILWKRSKRTRLPIQYAFLGFSGIALIGLQLVLPSSAINYGLLRVVQQALIVLSLPTIVALFAILRLLRRKILTAERIIGVFVVVVFLLLIGFLSSITGGDKAALPLSNDGFYYQAYLTHQTDIAGDDWLKSTAPLGSRVYADEFARRQLIAYDGIFAQPTVVPQALPVDSYVYLSTNDTTFAMIPFYEGGILSYYTVPYSFLNANKNLVYSSGGTEIYK